MGLLPRDDARCLASGRSDPLRKASCSQKWEREWWPVPGWEKRGGERSAGGTKRERKSWYTFDKRAFTTSEDSVSMFASLTPQRMLPTRHWRFTLPVKAAGNSDLLTVWITFHSPVRDFSTVKWTVSSITVIWKKGCLGVLSQIINQKHTQYHSYESDAA